MAAEPGHLREDSRALLKLLLESGQGYDDIAGVLGSDRDAVRERAGDALAELGGERPDAELTDYLLGQASPVERADMARRLDAEPGTAALAAELAERLRDIAPRASLPALPAAARATTPHDARPDDAVPGDGPAQGSRLRLLLAVAAIAIVVVGIVLLATGALSGDDEPAQPTSEELLEEADAVAVELAPVDDNEASGEAVLGLATADQPFVDLTMKGLGAIPSSDAYIVWLIGDGTRGWPLGLVEPNAQGEQSERYPVPSFLLSTSVVKGLREIVVSQSPREEAFEAADEAAKSGVAEVEFVGDAVASGRVPTTAPAPRE